MLLFSKIFFSYAGEAIDIGSSKKALLERGVFTGYASGDLIDKDDYELILAIFRFGFNLKPFLKNKFNFKAKGLVEFEIEPFINTVISPDSNVEVGFNLLLKYAYPITKKLSPYIEGGVGALYMSQHTLEQSTQYNFLSQVGAGLIYFLKPGLGLNLGYRYRHLSNSSIKRPNKGINVGMIVAGLSLYY